MGGSESCWYMSKSPEIIIIVPPGSRLKVECRIYKTRSDMLVATKKFTRNLYPNVGKDTMAYCEPTLRLLPNKQHLAVIFFNENDWTIGIVAHEMDHAANALMWRRGMRSIPCNLDMATEEEETHAEIMGELVDAFFKKRKL